MGSLMSVCEIEDIVGNIKSRLKMLERNIHCLNTLQKAESQNNAFEMEQLRKRIDALEQKENISITGHVNVQRTQSEVLLRKTNRNLW
jgi:hypothetical protein